MSDDPEVRDEELRGIAMELRCGWYPGCKCEDLEICVPEYEKIIENLRANEKNDARVVKARGIAMDKLIEALEPFAQIAERWEGLSWMPTGEESTLGTVKVDLADFARARDVLKEIRD